MEARVDFTFGNLVVSNYDPSEDKDKGTEELSYDDAKFLAGNLTIYGGYIISILDVLVIDESWAQHLNLWKSCKVLLATNIVEVDCQDVGQKGARERSKRLSEDNRATLHASLYKVFLLEIELGKHLGNRNSSIEV